MSTILCAGWSPECSNPSTMETSVNLNLVPSSVESSNKVENSGPHSERLLMDQELTDMSKASTHVFMSDFGPVVRVLVADVGVQMCGSDVDSSCCEMSLPYYSGRLFLQPVDTIQENPSILSVNSEMDKMLKSAPRPSLEDNRRKQNLGEMACSEPSEERSERRSEGRREGMQVTEFVRLTSSNSVPLLIAEDHSSSENSCLFGEMQSEDHSIEGNPCSFSKISNDQSAEENNSSLFLDHSKAMNKPSGISKDHSGSLSSSSKNSPRYFISVESILACFILKRCWQRR